MVNPFQVPHTEHAAEPLRPWQAPEHLEYYVDVDSVAQARASFHDQIALDQLARRGRLVVVTGEAGCGKSSLIHYFAEQVDAAVNRAAGGAGARHPGRAIVDLTGYEYSGPAESGETSRPLEVCREVLLALTEQEVITEEAELLDKLPLPDVHDAVASQAVRDAYRRLAKIAERSNFFPVVLLPPVADFRSDLGDHSYLARNTRGIVFLAESNEVDVVEEFLRSEPSRGRGTIAVQVSPIDVDDGCKLAANRIDKHPPGTVATVTPAEMRLAMEEVARWMSPISVQGLHAGLYRVWRHYEDVSPPPVLSSRDIVERLADDEDFRRR